LRKVHENKQSEKYMREIERDRKREREKVIDKDEIRKEKR
jgi:hypothetical protein